MSNNVTILGTWQSDPDDKATQEQFGNVVLEFTNDGQLVYTIFEDDKKQVLHLTYEIAGSQLITNQPSEERKDETGFKLSPDGNTLELIYDGEVSKYIRLK